MHVLLTDRLSCPRCGPSFGLILLADRMEERRVHEGVLGCPNCRDRFPVRDGFGDLRAPPRDPLPDSDVAGRAEAADGGGPGAPSGDAVTRVAALLGVAGGPGHLALAGPVARMADPLADLLDDIEVVAISALLRGRPEREGVSRIVAGPGLPFYDRTLRGVALSGEASARWLDEAARVVAPMGRVVVLDAPAGALDRLGAAGLEPVLDEDGIAVASR